MLLVLVLPLTFEICFSKLAGELTSLRESEEKLKLQQQESTRRENVLVMRLATKEQEMQELLVRYLYGTMLYNPTVHDKLPKFKSTARVQ